MKTLEDIKLSTVPAYNEAWSDTLKQAYHYDMLEIGGDTSAPAYSTLYDQRRHYTLKALQAYCPKGGAVLDLAAAAGNFSIAAARLGFDVTWNDLREELVEYVKLKVPKDHTLDYVPSNILDFPEIYHNKFDAVMALEVVEHVAYPDVFIRKVAHAVKPGGYLIMTTPNGDYFKNNLPRYSDFPDPSVFESIQFQPNSDGHIFLLYEDEMRRFGEQAGVELVEYRQFTNPLSAGHVKLRHLHKVMPASAIEAIEKLSGRFPKALSKRLMCSSLIVYKKP